MITSHSHSMLIKMRLISKPLQLLIGQSHPKKFGKMTKVTTVGCVFVISLQDECRCGLLLIKLIFTLEYHTVVDFVPGILPLSSHGL